MCRQPEALLAACGGSALLAISEICCLALAFTLGCQRKSFVWVPGTPEGRKSP